MEGVPDEGFVYLIGMTGRRGRCRGTVLLLGRQQGPGGGRSSSSSWPRSAGTTTSVVFCYGSYERAFLKRMRKATQRKEPVDRVLGSLVNVLSRGLRPRLLPLLLERPEGRGRLPGLLLDATRTPRASRASSGGRRWEATQDEQWKQKLLAYNQEDCAALRRVADFLRRRPPGASAGSRGTHSGAGRPSPSSRSWTSIGCRRTASVGQSMQFVHADFEYVNGCAYFDYQRERVFVRSSKTIRRSSGEGTQEPKPQAPRSTRRVQS